MAQINLSDYKDLYLQTTRKTIDSLLANCNRLASNLRNKKAVNDIHIESHSLKSRSQIMGYNDIANICLNIEKISDDTLQGTSQLNNEAVLNIKKEAEKLNEMLKLIQHDNVG